MSIGTAIIWSKSDATGAGILVFVGLALTVLGLVGHRVTSAKLPGGTEVVLAELLRASNELEKSGEEEGAALLRDAADLVDEATPRSSAASPPTIGLGDYRALTYEREVLRALRTAFPNLKENVVFHGAELDAMFNALGMTLLVEITHRLTVEKLRMVRGKFAILAEGMGAEIAGPARLLIITRNASTPAIEMARLTHVQIATWEPSEGPEALLEKLGVPRPGGIGGN